MKPGLYVATVHGVENVTTWGPDRHGGFRWFDDDGDVLGCSDAFVTDARPLVVLDPESGEDCRRLADALNEMDGAPAWLTRGAATLLRALADPKPERRIARLVRRISVPDQMWVCGTDMKWRDEYGTVWDEIPSDVEVLSEGWSE